MTKELTVFEGKTPDFAGFSVRAMVGENGEPWFVAKDVCEVLEIGNSRQALSYLDDDEKGVTTNDTLGGRQQMAIISEPGLYSLILRSRKPQAKAFKRWITHEVIPAIRKHGGYLTAEKIEEALADPDTIIKLATALKDEREQRKLAQAKVIEMEPKAKLHDLLMSVPDGTMTVDEAAKLLCFRSKRKAFGPIGQRELFEILRDKSILRQGDGHNQPYQKYIDQGYFVVRRWVKESSESERSGMQSLLTFRGVAWLAKKLEEWGYDCMKTPEQLVAQFQATIDAMTAKRLRAA